MFIIKVYYASEDLRNDDEIVYTAVTQACNALHYASNRLKANRELVLIAIKQGIDQRIWRDLPPIIHQDLEVVEA